jgi:glutamate racemase
MSLKEHAIGIFDSGVGGLTVMQKLIQTLPHERFIYFGDTGRVPYGNKSAQTVLRYSIESTICLLQKNIKFLVVACNTVDAMALSKLRLLFNIPIVGVIDPGAEKAVAVTRTQCIGVLGTKGTIHSGAYQAAIQKLAPQATIVPIACPLFVPLVEEHWIHHPVTHLIVQEYLKPLSDQNIDTLLLGCTHYPLLSSIIQQHVGSEVKLVDSASNCAVRVAHLLQKNNLLASKLQGQHQYFVSDDPKKFHAFGERIFGYPFESVELLLPE